MKNIVLVSSLILSSIMAHAQSVDLSKSTFTWRGSKISGSFHSGPIKMKTASLKNGKGEFVADMSSIEDITLQGEWKKKFLGHIKSADFFDVAKFPTATFKIEKIKDNKFIGKLTIKNKTQDVAVSFKKKKDTYRGKLTFDRTKFGIIYGSGNFFKNLGDKVISDEVTLKFKIVIH